MTGSMYAAVSGLKAHMNALNVIGNNVSNVNTTGYKATRYTFNEALYTTQRSGSDGTQIAGGRNPAQIGFGSSIGTIDLDMSTKNYTPTGQLLDTMIDGDGFFFVGDKELGSGATAVAVGDSTTLKGMNLTRLGNFNVDPNGYLVDGNGSVVWGFLEEEANALTRFNLTTGAVTKPTVGENNALTAAEASAGTLLTNLTADDVEALKKLGVELHNVKYEKYELAANETTPAEGKTVGQSYVVSATMTQSAAMGAIRLPTAGNNAVAWPKYTAAQDPGYDPQDPTKVTKPAEPAKFEDTGTVRLESDSTTIDEKSGALRIMTSDGELYTIGYLAIAKVTNPNGVTHVDGRYYQAQDGAGTIRVTSIMGAVTGTGVDSAGDTKLITGGLESSGTDLATEITNMITVQRGYQANTRIVTVTDSMLEELVNMKR